MSKQQPPRMALDVMVNVPGKKVGPLLYEATSAAADAQIEEMAVDLQEIRNVGRQTALEILFALGRLLEQVQEDGDGH